MCRAFLQDAQTWKQASQPIHLPEPLNSPYSEDVGSGWHEFWPLMSGMPGVRALVHPRSSHVNSTLGHVTCFGQWDPSKLDASRDLKSAYVLNLILEYLILEVPCCSESSMVWLLIGERPCRERPWQRRACLESPSPQHSSPRWMQPNKWPQLYYGE